MDESSGSRFELSGARVFLHLSEHGGERILHIDVDHPDLNKIIQPREASYVGGRDGGLFIGLRAAQLERAEALVRELNPVGTR